MFWRGICLIVLVAMLWVMDSMLTQGILVTMDYAHPIFLTYMNMCGFSLWTLVWFYHRKPAEIKDERAKCYHIGIAALAICPPWFFANVTYNVSLGITSVASNTVLCNTSSLWTLLLSRVVLGTPITGQNCISVALSIAGALFVVTGDKNSDAVHSDHSILGDFFAVTSAILYGVYTVLLQKMMCKSKCNQEDGDGTTLLFGLMGIFGAACLWPILIVIDVTRYEPFALPPQRVLGMFTLTSLVGTVLPQLLWAKGVLMTSPLVATLGLSLTIPLSMVADGLWNHRTYSMFYVMGCVLVASGFIVANVELPSTKRCPFSGAPPEEERALVGITTHGFTSTSPLLVPADLVHPRATHSGRRSSYGTCPSPLAL